jgi:uncharacterized RDD family membrane protein YckC
VGRREALGGWLDGPGGRRRRAEADEAFTVGARLGRPVDGRGSVASFGRRLAGVAIDWAIALVVARALAGPGPWAPLAVFAVENLLLVGTIGTTIGHRLVGVRVELVAGGAPGPARAATRTALLCLVAPALVWDADHRGLHDKAAGTLVART